MGQSPRSFGKKAKAVEPLCEISPELVEGEPRWYHEKTRPCIADMLYEDEFFYLLFY